jgi:hypothetical protein
MKMFTDVPDLRVPKAADVLKLKSFWLEGTVLVDV